MVKFETTNSMYGSQVTIAYIEETEEQGISKSIKVLGKHYASSGLGWNYFNPIREIVSIGDWKAGVLNAYERLNREGRK